MAKVHFFDVSLAVKYGPVESIILSNLCWWIEKNRENKKHYHNGRYWVYNSIKAFENLFPYLNGEQIRRTIDRLRKEKVLYVGKFNKTGYDRTLWYSVNDEVMELYRDKETDAYLYKKYTGNSPECPNGKLHLADSTNGNDQTVNTEGIPDKETPGSASSGGRIPSELPENGSKTGEKARNNPGAPEKLEENGQPGVNLPECPNGKLHLANSTNANDQTVNTDVSYTAGVTGDDLPEDKKRYNSAENMPVMPEIPGEGPSGSGETSQKELCGANASEGDLPELPNGKFDLANLPNANDQTVNSICRIQQMDLSNLPNRFVENAKPIPVINIVKPAAAAIPEKKSKNKEAAAESLYQKITKEAIRDTLRRISKELIFDSVFYKKAEEYMNSENLDIGYLEWIYRECQKREPGEFRRMYYALIFKQDLTEIYKTRAAEIRQSLITCPVCGKEHDKNDLTCPECHLRKDDLQNEGIIPFEKRMFNLDDITQEKYAYELREILKTCHGVEFEERKKVLRKKYHLLE
jgi:rubrerythrin